MIRIFVIMVVVVGLLFVGFVALNIAQQVLSNPNVLDGIRTLAK